MPRHTPQPGDAGAGRGPTAPCRWAGIRAAPCSSARPTGCPPPRWPTCCGPCSPASTVAELQRAGRRPRRRRRRRDDRPGRRRWSTAGVVTTATPPRDAGRPSIRIHGRGPLSDLLAGALRCSGARVRHSSLSHAGVDAGDDRPRGAGGLPGRRPAAGARSARRRSAAPAGAGARRHRTGRPLVIPGVTSCLRCADLHRSDRDAAWPAVAAQLRDAVGSADRATVLATAALALNQVDRVIERRPRSRRRPGPARAAADPGHHPGVRRRTPARPSAADGRRHPRCDC